MINVDGQKVTLVGSEYELMAEFIAVLGSFKAFANKQYPDDPQKAADSMIKAMQIGFNAVSVECPVRDE